MAGECFGAGRLPGGLADDFRSHGMKERRQPTRREWEQITSSRPVVRRIPNANAKPPEDAERLDRIAAQQLNNRLEDEEMFRERGE
jgi:hypothetical protein